MRFDRVRRTASPLLVVAVALAGVAAYSYLRGESVPATALGVAAILASLFAVLTDG